MNHKLERLELPVLDGLFAKLPGKQGGKVKVRMPADRFMALHPKPWGWDRVRFTLENTGEFREFDFEGIDFTPKYATFNLGDLKLKT